MCGSVAGRDGSEKILEDFKMRALERIAEPARRVRQLDGVLRGVVDTLLRVGRDAPLVPFDGSLETVIVRCSAIPIG